MLRMQVRKAKRNCPGLRPSESRPLVGTAAGQAMVETALMLSFVLILMLAIIEFGFLLWASVQITNAAREGARAGTLWEDIQGGQICSETVRRAVGGNGQTTGELPPNWSVNVSIEVLGGGVCGETGKPLKVTVSHDFALPLITNFPIIGDIIGPTFNIARAVTMRIQ